MAAARTRADVARSVNSRLKDAARKRGVETRLLQIQYAQECFLRRYARSAHMGRLVLKGGTMLLCMNEFARPTEDTDMHLADGPIDPAEVVSIVRDVFSVEAEQEDGVELDESEIKHVFMREGFRTGLRLTVPVKLGESPLMLKFDICDGDVMVPGVVLRRFQGVLDGSPFDLPTYPWETYLAEKLHAIVEFGLDTTRMKDFYDIMVVSRSETLDGDILAEAVKASFSQRGTPLPTVPIALTESFSRTHADDFARWRKKRGPLGTDVGSLEEVVKEIAGFLLPVIGAINEGTPLPGRWVPGQGWGDAPRLIPTP
jgi:predicted nucleotidyltransferase component of viral defense system